jgi:hypothetical protein
MAFWTLDEVKAKVRQDLDIDEDELVQDTELNQYVQDAVREVASTLIKLNYEDRYFLTDGTLNLVSGQIEYDLPADIYGTKIVRLLYKNGTRMYPIKRIRGMREFEDIMLADHYATTSDSYKYMLINRGPSTGFKIRLVPASQETSSNVTIWYIRQPYEATLGTDNVDCPEEFIQVVLNFVKFQCLKKDLGNPLLELAIAEYKETKQDMVDTLSEQTADGDNEITPDRSHYEEMV